MARLMDAFADHKGLYKRYERAMNVNVTRVYDRESTEESK